MIIQLGLSKIGHNKLPLLTNSVRAIQNNMTLTMQVSELRIMLFNTVP